MSSVPSPSSFPDQEVKAAAYGPSSVPAASAGSTSHPNGGEHFHSIVKPIISPAALGTTSASGNIDGSLTSQQHNIVPLLSLPTASASVAATTTANNASASSVRNSSFAVTNTRHLLSVPPPSSSSHHYPMAPIVALNNSSTVAAIASSHPHSHPHHLPAACSGSSPSLLSAPKTARDGGPLANNQSFASQNHVHPASTSSVPSSPLVVAAAAKASTILNNNSFFLLPPHSRNASFAASPHPQPASGLRKVNGPLSIEDVPLRPLKNDSVIVSSVRNYQNTNRQKETEEGSKRNALELPIDKKATIITLENEQKFNATSTITNEHLGSGGADATAAKIPPPMLKWFIVVLTCIFLFGTDYCYDLPGAFGAGGGATLQSYFAANGKTYNNKMNQALYSVYSYPNMVMTLVGGLLIDKYLGLHKTTLLFSFVAVTGSFIFAVGVWWANYQLMIFGRLMLGCSGENLFVVQSAFVAKWFAGTNSMALAFGIAVSFSRLGGGLAYILSPWAAESTLGVPSAAFLGFVVGAISLGGAVALIIVDYRSEAKGNLLSTTTPAVPTTATTIAAVEEGEGSSLKSPSSPQPTSVVVVAEEMIAPPLTFQLSFIPSLPKTLWFLALSSLLCYGSTFAFIPIAKTYFMRVYASSDSDASFATSLFHLVAAVLAPLIGVGVDKVGKGPMWLAVSTSGLAATFAFLLAVPATLGPILLMLTLSFFYSIFISGIWSFSPFTVPDIASGFGFGVMIAGTNFGLATSPLIVGTILDSFTPIAVAVTTEGASVFSTLAKKAAASAASSSSSSVSSLRYFSPFSATENDAEEGGAMGDDTVTTNELLLPTAAGYSCAITYLMLVAIAGLVVAFILWKVDTGSSSSSQGDEPILMASPDKRTAARARRDEALISKWVHDLRAAASSSSSVSQCDGGASTAEASRAVTPTIIVSSKEI